MDCWNQNLKIDETTINPFEIGTEWAQMSKTDAPFIFLPKKEKREKKKKTITDYEWLQHQLL